MPKWSGFSVCRFSSGREKINTFFLYHKATVLYLVSVSTEKKLDMLIHSYFKLENNDFNLYISDNKLQKEIFCVHGFKWLRLLRQKKNNSSKSKEWPCLSSLFKIE